MTDGEVKQVNLVNMNQGNKSSRGPTGTSTDIHVNGLPGQVESNQDIPVIPSIKKDSLLFRVDPIAMKWPTSRAESMMSSTDSDSDEDTKDKRKFGRSEEESVTMVESFTNEDSRTELTKVSENRSDNDTIEEIIRENERTIGIQVGSELGLTTEPSLKKTEVGTTNEDKKKVIAPLKPVVGLKARRKVSTIKTAKDLAPLKNAPRNRPQAVRSQTSLIKLIRQPIEGKKLKPLELPTITKLKPIDRNEILRLENEALPPNMVRDNSFENRDSLRTKAHPFKRWSENNANSTGSPVITKQPVVKPTTEQRKQSHSQLDSDEELDSILRELGKSLDSPEKPERTKRVIRNKYRDTIQQNRRESGMFSGNELNVYDSEDQLLIDSIENEFQRTLVK